MSVQQRLKRELAELRKHPLEHISAGPVDEANLCLWSATLSGPPDTPYEDGIFSLSITFPDEYPFKPPLVRFITPIYHPNIGRGELSPFLLSLNYLTFLLDGTICMDSLYSKWNPTLTVDKVRLSLLGILFYLFWIT